MTKKDQRHMNKKSKLYASLDENKPSHKIVIEINQKNESLYGPYHEKCDQFAHFCTCVGEDSIRPNKRK